MVIYDDDVPEGVEELNITLSLQDPSLADKVTVRPAVATVRIRDNDSKFDTTSGWFHAESFICIPLLQIENGIARIINNR